MHELVRRRKGGKKRVKQEKGGMKKRGRIILRSGRVVCGVSMRCIVLWPARCTDSSGCVLGDIVGSDDQDEGTSKTKKSSTHGLEECAAQARMKNIAS